MNEIKISSAKCKKLTVVQSVKNGFIGFGKPPVSFSYNGFQVTVEDCGVRNVIVESQTEVDTNNLLRVFLQLNQLSMICDGSFLNIDNVCFDGIQKSVDKLELLSFYTTKSDLYGDKLSLINSISLLSLELMNAWDEICSELVFPNNAFFYMSSIEGLPLDFRAAYLTECFEPLAEYIAEKRNEKIPQQYKKSYLYNCLTYIMSLFGDEIYSNEKVASIQDYRIEQLANNRHRLMHLKKDFEGELLKDGYEGITYSRKTHLLYRHTLLQLMGVDIKKYLPKLQSCIAHWDRYLIEVHQNGDKGD